MNGRGLSTVELVPALVAGAVAGRAGAPPELALLVALAFVLGACCLNLRGGRVGSARTAKAGAEGSRSQPRRS